MPQYGFSVKTGSGDILMDGEHSHPQLLETKMLTYSAAGTFDIPFTPTNKMVFVTAFSENALVSVCWIASSNGQYNSVRIIISGAGNITLRVYEI